MTLTLPATIGGHPGLRLRGTPLIDPEALKQPRSAPDFRVVTGALKAIGNADDRLLAVTASSNVIDLAGDRMAFSALQCMEKDAQDRLTIFVNHEYRVPEDVFGTVEKSALVTRDGFVDLDMTIGVVPADQNERADRAYRMITQSKTKLGVSIGAQILDYAIVEEPVNGVLTKLVELRLVRLLEASIVGIPANQRSWVQNAIKSLNASNPDNLKRIYQVPDLAALHKCAACDCGCTATEADPTCTCQCDACVAVRTAAAEAPATAETPAPEAATVTAAEQPYTLTVGPESVKGIIAVELAEREFRRTMWQLVSALEEVIWNQMSQENGDPVSIRNYVRSAIAEFATLMDTAVAAALSAGVAGPEDNDRSATSEDDDLTALCAVVPALLRARDQLADAGPHLQLAHDHIAARLNLACGSATAEATPESSASAVTAAPAKEVEVATLLSAQAEVERSLAAAQSVVEECRATLATLEGRKTALQGEITDLEQQRSAELKRSTGRPSEGPREPIRVKDLIQMSNDDILKIAETPVDLATSAEATDPALVGLV